MKTLENKMQCLSQSRNLTAARTRPVPARMSSARSDAIAVRSLSRVRRLTSDLTRAAHEAFNIILVDNDERGAAEAPGRMS